jgi:type IV pilus assembly protein PilM
MSLKLFRNKSFVGLDLGASTIKAVQIDRTQAGWRVSKACRTATPKGTIKDGVVTDANTVGDTIHQLLKDSHIAATSAVIGAAGASVVVRSVRIPKMPEAVLRKSIKFEAGRYVPSSIEDSFIEFEIMGDTEDGSMDVLVVAAPRDIVESRVRACEAAGLDVEIVDVEAFAMYRSIVEADPTHSFNDEVIALVDVGAHTTNVSVVTKGVFSMTRSIPQAGDTLTEALASYFKLSEEDAESGKAQLDLGALISENKPTENPPLRVIQPHVDDLVREIRRSLNYFQSQQTEAGHGQNVDKVVLSGGGSALNGLAEYMHLKLGLEVVRLGVFDNPRFVHPGHEDARDGLAYAVASGLAMRPFAKAA